MKLAVANLRAILSDKVGLEGVLLIFGTLLLAAGSSYLSPAGPWVVTGSVALVLGLALAIAPTTRGN